MKHLFSILLLFVFNISFSQIDTLELSEVGVGSNSDFFDIRNTSNVDYDPSHLWIFKDGVPKAMNTVSALCAFPPSNLVIDANDQQAFLTGFSNEGGELVLAKRDIIEGPDDIVDYVIWGNATPNFEDEAVQAGLWIEGTRAPSFFTEGSIEFDGEGNSGTDWNAQAKPSPCQENGSGCDVFEPNVSLGETFYCNCLTYYTDFSVSYNGSTEFIFGALVDNNDTIRYISSGFSLGDFDEMICYDSDLSYLVVGYDGQQVGFEVGNSLNDIQGCYIFSERFDLENISLPESDYSFQIYGEEADTSAVIPICLLDNIDDAIEIATESTVDLVSFIYDENSNIIAQFEGIGALITLDDLAPGTYQIISYAYGGELGDSNGYYFANPNIDGCWRSDSPPITVEILEPNSTTCISNTDDLVDLEAFITTTVSNNALNIVIEGINYSDITFQLLNLNGQEIIKGYMDSSEKSIELNNINSGIYLINFSSELGNYSKKIFISK